MKEKIFAMIAILILISSPALAVCPGDPGCPEEEVKWEDMTLDQKFESQPQRAFNENPSSANFNNRAKVLKTAENLGKIKPKPLLENFKVTPSEEQAKYLEGNYNRDFAEDFFKGNELARAPSAANTYLQEQFGNKDISFNVVAGMRYSDIPSPKITVKGVELSLRPGAAKGEIPPGTTTIGFDSDKGQFVFEPRGIKVEGETITVNEDGSFTFDNGGAFVDPQTGAQVQIGAGSNVRFTEGGIIVNGQAEGEVKGVSFQNFEGQLTITDKVISSENSRVNYQGKEIQGKFVASLDKGKIRHVSLLTSESSYKDSQGRLMGQANIEFYENENWKSIHTVDDYCRLDYGDPAKENLEGRQHYLIGQFEVNFNQDSSLNDAKMLSPNSIYRDRINDIYVMSAHEAQSWNENVLSLTSEVEHQVKHLVFSDLPKTKDEMIALGKGSEKNKETLVIIGTKGDVTSYGRDLYLSVKGDSIHTLKDETFTHTYSEGDNTFMKLDSDRTPSKEEIFAIMGKGFKVGDLTLKEGFVRQEQLISYVSNENGKMGLEVDGNSRALLTDIKNDLTKFWLVRGTFMLELGEEQSYFGVSEDFGVRYEPDKGNVVNFLSPMNSLLYLGRKETGAMMAQALFMSRSKYTQKGYLAGDSVNLVTEEGVLEAVILSVVPGQIALDTNGDGKPDKVITGDSVLRGGPSPKERSQRLELYARKGEEASRLLTAYEHEQGNQRKAAETNLMNFYLSKELNLPLKTSVSGVVTLQTPDGTPLYYKTELINGRETITAWSPDQENWMGLDELTVKGGKWEGIMPTKANQEIINILMGRSGDILYLHEVTRKNPDYKLYTPSLETRKYDEWYDNFEKKYSGFTDLTQNAALQAAEAFLSENNIDGALKFYQNVIDTDPKSEIGQMAKKNINVIQSQRSLQMAKMLASQRYFQEMRRARPRSVISGGKYYEQLIEAGYFSRGMSGLSSISPWNIARDLTRASTVNEIENNLEASGKSVMAAGKLIEEGHASDLREAAILIKAATAGKPVYRIGQKIKSQEHDLMTDEPFWSPGDWWSGPSEGEIIDRYVKDGEWVYVIGKDGKPFTHKVTKGWTLTEGWDVKYGVPVTLTLKEGGDSISTDHGYKKFTVSGDIMEEDQYTLMDSKLKDEFHQNYDKIQERAQSLLDSGTLSGLSPACSAFLENDLSVQTGIQMLSIPIDDPQRESKMLELAQKYREEDNFEGAAMIARQLSQTSEDPKIQQEAYDIYNDIVDPEGQWLNFADETLHDSTIFDITAEVANPFAWVTFSWAGRMIGAGLSMIPGGATVLSATGKVLNLPTKLIGSSASPALKGVAGTVFRIGVEEIVLEELVPWGVSGAVGIFAGPKAGTATYAALYPFMIGLTGGADTMDQAQLAARTARNAFKNVELEVDARVHVDSSKTRISQVYNYEGDINIAKLRELGEADVVGSTIRFLNKNTGEVSFYVKKGTKIAAFEGDLVDVNTLRRSMESQASFEQAKTRMKTVQDYPDAPAVEVVGEQRYFDYFRKKVNDQTIEFKESFNEPLAAMKKELTEMFPDAEVGGRLKKDYKIEEKIFRDLKSGDLEAREDVFSARTAPEYKMRDVAGTRAEFDNLEGIAAASKKVRERIDSGEWELLAHKDYINNPKGGYRAEHYIVGIEGKPVEIQLRTKEQSIWADWTHDTVYKGRFKSDVEVQNYAKATGDWVYEYNLKKGQGIRSLPACPSILKAAGLCFSCC